MAVSVGCERVVKTFGEVRAVDDVTLAVEPGELFFLLGPSGCGKTTLLRCIAGFCEPDAGVLRIGGADITRVPPHRRGTGMVFQSYALWPHLTVWQNVAFGLELRRRPREEIRRRVGEALERVRMADRARQRPNQLSGGQQQRVALARALVIEPTCLLLDEPLSNLDAKLRLEMRAEIRRICKQAGLTALYVTHDQKEALSIADRVAVLRAGRVEQCGAPQEVYRRPANRFVAGFIGETNVLDGTLAAVDAGRARVRTAWGELISAAPLPPGLAAGGAVAVSIRPEAIRIGTEPAGMPNAFDASLHHTVYLGEMAQHEVQRADGAGAPALKAFELRPRVVARDDRSHRTRIWVDPDDVVLVSA